MIQLFNIDLHISVIADVKNIFNKLYPNIQISDWSLSGHNWVFNKKPTSVEILTQNSWPNLNLDIIKQFQHKYDDILSSFDGFIVCHPNAFVFLFEKYNKPIIMVNSCRYDMPFCWNNNLFMISEFHELLKRLTQKNLLTVISNNNADYDYFKAGNPNIEPYIIPSLCLYTGVIWNKFDINNKFLLYSGNIPDHNLIVKRKSIGRFGWNDLMKFNGIIHIPYEASTMSIFEHISSGIPLFFPSKQFLKELIINNGSHFQSNYWKHHNLCPPDYLKHTQNIDFWLDNADYYNIEGYYYFDSFPDLFQKLNNFNDDLYDIRIKWIKDRYDLTLKQWNSIITSTFNIK